VADDSQLVLRAQIGDREAFGIVAERCRPWVLGLCLRLLGDRAAAEDATQEALLLAMRDVAQLREPERFRAWLGRIAANVCRMRLRQMLARPAEVLDRPHEMREAPASQEEPLPVEQALGQLELPARRLLALFYLDGLSHRELADALALSEAAVKSRLHRARRRLRKEMLAMMTEEQKARLGAAEPAQWALRTILVVEPDEGIRGALLQSLRQRGYEVQMLPTGEAALEAIAQRRGQMLILDKDCVEPHWTEVLLIIQVDAWARENVPVGVLVDDCQRDRLLAWQGGAVLCLTRPPQAAEVARYVDRIAKMWTDDLHPQGCKRDACGPGQ
jgi:RNA polymerase sigma-70 factor (ECF subfamily)